jgi:hypothetical protein
MLDDGKQQPGTKRRGRKSAASRDVVHIRDDLGDVVPRPAPLPELTPEEADEWRCICNAVPSTYFPPATWIMVAQYCRHVVFARHLAQMIRQVASSKKKFDMAHYRTLLREHRAEGAAIAGLLRSMRLTHLSSYTDDRTPLPEATPKPWLS